VEDAVLNMQAANFVVLEKRRQTLYILRKKHKSGHLSSKSSGNVSDAIFEPPTAGMFKEEDNKRSSLVSINTTSEQSDVPFPEVPILENSD